MKASEAKRLKEMESENARLKRLVAIWALDIEMIKELAEDAPIDRQVMCRRQRTTTAKCRARLPERSLPRL
jgi:hypothetical protein